MTTPVRSQGQQYRPGKVLFIVIDQMRADCLTGALAGAARLSNLRALMAESVIFTHHFTVTTPCGPARASLLTGLYAMNHRSVRNGTPLSRHHTNLALEVRKTGREPLLFGYTDTSPDPEGLDPADPALTDYEGLMPGFTEVTQLRMDSPASPWLADLKAKGYALPAEHLEVYRAAGQGLDAPTLYRAEDSDTAFLANETLKALSIREDQDWFAHVTFIRPHPPLAAPAPWNALIAPGSVPPADLPASVETQKASHPFFAAFFAEPSVKSLHIGFDGRMDRTPAAERESLRAVYLGLAAEVDHHVGRLLDYLKASNQYDDTLIVVTGDHGEMLGDHFMWGKESVLEPALRVPLIVRDPRNRRAAGTVVEALTESIDVAPTILEWLGREPPSSFNGRALTAFLEGREPAAWRDHIFAELDLGHPLAATRYQRHLGLDLAHANVAILRERRWKYVHFNGRLPPLLFDLRTDPAEMTNLAEDPVHTSQIARLLRRMIDHRMSHAHHALTLTHPTDGGAISAPPPSATR